MSRAGKKRAAQGKKASAIEKKLAALRKEMEKLEQEKLAAEQQAAGEEPAPADQQQSTSATAGSADPAEEAVDWRDVDLPKYLPRLSANPRAKRLKEWVYLVAEHFASQGVGNPSEAAIEAVIAQVEKLANRPFHRSQMKRLEKSLPAVDRRNVSESVELAAVMRLGPVVWLFNLLQVWNDGRPGFRSLPAAVLLCMSFCAGRPVTRWTRNRFLDGEPALKYAFGPVVGARGAKARKHRGSKESAFYDSLRFITERHNTETVAWINVELFRRLAELRDAKGGIRFEELAVYCSVDGKDIEADVPQVPPRGQSHKQWIQKQMARRGLCLADWRSYGPDNEEHWKELWGWKIVVVTCLKSGLALGWILIPATGDEREALREILALIFKAWPSCPIRYLAGDSYYDHSKDLAYDLRFRMGITPCFHKHGEYSQALPYCDGVRGEEGVAICKHGYMKLVRVAYMNSLTAEKRIEAAQAAEEMRAKIASGEAAATPENLAAADFRLPLEGQVADDMRLGFACPDAKQPCTTREVVTNPREDARVYTELPRLGEGKKAALRVALQTRRLASESINALMTHRGMAGRGPERKAKGTDAQVDWTMSLGLLWLTARALIHADGSYATTAEDMFRHGMLDGADSEGAVFDDLLCQRVKRELGPAAATLPRNWTGPAEIEGYNRELRPRKGRAAAA